MTSRQQSPPVFCGYPLGTPTDPSARCQHRVRNKRERWCFQHRRLVNRLSKQAVQPVSADTGCQLVQGKSGQWRCQTHSGDAWAAAEALGANPPCRLPLPSPVRVGLAGHPQLDWDTANMLANDPDETVRIVLAKNERTPRDIVDRLTADHSTEVRRAVALRADLVPEQIEAIVEGDDPGVRWITIGHPATTPEQLRRWSHSDDQTCRCAVAHHPNTPPDVLQQLAKDQSTSVIRNVAENAHTPPEVLEQLFVEWRGRAFFEITQAIAGNIATPPGILLQFMEYGGDVAKAAAKNPMVPIEHLQAAARQHYDDWSKLPVSQRTWFVDSVAIGLIHNKALPLKMRETLRQTINDRAWNQEAPIT